MAYRPRPDYYTQGYPEPYYGSLEGEYTVGFEQSSLDGHIWVKFAEGVPFPAHHLPGPPRRSRRRALVRLTGYIEGEPDGEPRFGHLGGYDMQITVTEPAQLLGAWTYD